MDRLGNEVFEEHENDMNTKMTWNIEQMQLLGWSQAPECEQNMKYKRTESGIDAKIQNRRISIFMSYHMNMGWNKGKQHYFALRFGSHLFHMIFIC